jgi:hypothetical protein
MFGKPSDSEHLDIASYKVASCIEEQLSDLKLV